MDYPSIRSVYEHLATRASGEKYVDVKMLMKSYVEPVMHFVRFLGFDDPESLLAAIRGGKVNLVDVVARWRRVLTYETVLLTPKGLGDYS